MQVKDANRNRRTIGTVAVVCLVAQLALSPNLALGGGRANFAFVCAASLALSIGGGVGVVAGFVSGLLFDLATTGPIGLMALLLTVCGFLLGIERRDRIADELSSSLLLAALASLCVSLAYHLMMLALGQASSVVDALFLRTLPTALLTIVAFVPFALVLARRTSAPRGRAGHYSIGAK